MTTIDTKEAEIQILLKLIEDKTGYTLADLESPNRKRELVHVRRAFFAIVRKVLKLSFERIGAILGKNHTTVIHGINKHNAEIDVYDDYSRIYKNLYDSLNVLYIARTTYSVDYMEKQVHILIVQRNLIDKRIGEYEVRIKEVSAGK